MRFGVEDDALTLAFCEDATGSSRLDFLSHRLRLMRCTVRLRNAHATYPGI